MYYDEEFIPPYEIIRRRDAIKATWDEATRRKRLVCKEPPFNPDDRGPRVVDLHGAGLSNLQLDVQEYYG